MPAMHFHVRWPDGQETVCYSPSLIVKDYLSIGASYPMDDFLRRTREALDIASERVRQKFGFACSRASDQLGEIEAFSNMFCAPDDKVTVLAFTGAD
jgi:uncharacterized repeat protein (TIGR04042 family)